MSDTVRPAEPMTVPPLAHGLGKALPQHNRVHNRALILQSLFRGGPMTRAELSRESGLTRPTVSVLVSDLEATGIVGELGPREGVHVGKPGTLVEISPDSVHMVVLDLSNADAFLGAVVNLRGEVVGRSRIERDGAVGEEAVSRAIRLGERLLTLTPRRILGMGVGSPGIVDPEGVVREALHLEWSGLRLRERLAQHFRLPVYVINDANAAGLGAHTFRQVPGESLMVVTMRHGVGVGLILGGSLVQGEQFSAGEIGHVTAQDGGPLCACGRHGCLEAVIGAKHLEERIQGLGAGETAAVLAQAGQALGVVIAPIISALNLNEVVLSGPSSLIDGTFLDAAVETVLARTVPVVSKGLRVRAAEDDGDLVLLGAAALVRSSELGVF